MEKWKKACERTILQAIKQSDNRYALGERKREMERRENSNANVRNERATIFRRQIKSCTGLKDICKPVRRTPAKWWCTSQKAPTYLSPSSRSTLEDTTRCDVRGRNKKIQLVQRGIHTVCIKGDFQMYLPNVLTWRLKSTFSSRIVT